MTTHNTTVNAEQENLEMQQQNIVSFQQKLAVKAIGEARLGTYVDQLVEDLFRIQKTRGLILKIMPVSPGIRKEAMVERPRAQGHTVVEIKFEFKPC